MVWETTYHSVQLFRGRFVTGGNFTGGYFSQEVIFREVIVREGGIFSWRNCPDCYGAIGRISAVLVSRHDADLFFTTPTESTSFDAENLSFSNCKCRMILKPWLLVATDSSNRNCEQTYLIRAWIPVTSELLLHFEREHPPLEVSKTSFQSHPHNAMNKVS